MAVGTSRKLTKYRITILALFVVMAMVGGAIIASPAAAESDSTEHVLDGTVTDEEGEPLEDVFVDIFQDSDHIEDVLTDENGEYEIELEEGEYTVEPDADGFVSEFAIVELNEDQTQDFELEAAGVVEGTVTNENDDEVEGVRVTAEHDGSSTGTWTDKNGEYSIDVPEGENTVGVTDAEFEGDSEVVTVEQGETKTQDLDVTQLTIGTLEGTVTHNEEEPVEDARISIRQDGDFIKSVETDEEGAYEVELGEGGYSLSIDKDGFVSEERDTNIEGETTTEDFELEELATVEGEVIDEDGEPLEDAGVDVLQDGDLLASTTTDSDGQYDIEIEADEVDYSVIAFKDGFRFDERTVNVDEGVTIEENFTLKELVTLEGQVTDTENTPLEGVEVSPVPEGVVVSGDETDSDGQYEIDLVSGEEYTIEVSDNVHGDTSEEVMLTESDTKDFELEPLDTGTLEGEVLDGDGEPLEDAIVDIRQDEEFVDGVVVDSDGQYEFELATGEYTVTALKDGFTAEQRTVEIEEDAVSEETFAVEELFTLTGEVTDTDENPIEEVDITIVEDGDPVRNATTTSDGEYEVQLTAGEYTFEFSDRFHEDTSEKVTIPEEDTKDFELERVDTGTLEGEVSDQRGESVEDAFVGIEQNGDAVDDLRTDVDGQYDVELPTGEYTVTAAKSGFDSEERTVNVDEGTTSEEDFELSELFVLNGVVTDSNGDVIEGVDINIIEDENTVKEIETDSDGGYHITLPAGEYTVELSDSVHEDTSEEVILTESETRNFELESLSTGTLEGEVTDEDGEPIEESSISIIQDGSSVEFVWIDEDGSYEVELEEGEYSLFVDGNGYLNEQESVSITEDVTTTQDFELEIAGTIEGTVRNEDGTALEGVRVTAGQDGSFTGTLTGPDGQYSIDVPEGENTVSIADSEFEENSEVVSVQKGENTTQNLETTRLGIGTLEGTVTDEENNPVGDVSISILQNGHFIESATTANDGTYTLELGEGEYTVFADTEDAGALATSVSVEDDETTTENFGIQERGTAEGSVLDDTDTELSDGTVEVRYDDDFLFEFQTEGDGSYEFELPPGEYTLTGNADGYEAQTHEITLSEGENTTQNFELDSEDDDGGSTGGGGGAPSLGPADFEVSIRDAPDSVVAGETVSVEVAVNNVGGTTGEQTITLSMDGEQIGDESLELSRDQQRFITLTGEVDESAAGEHTFTISSDDDSAETALTIEGDTEEETDETDETDDSETEETDEDDAGETDTDETEDDSEAASDDSTETDETDDEPAEDEIVEDDDQPGFGVTVAVIALLGLLVGTRLSRNE